VGRRYGELCFTKQGTRKLLRIDHCWIMHPQINELLPALQGRLAGFRAHQVAVRVGANTGDLLINPTLPPALEVPSGQTELFEELLGHRFRVAAPAFFQVNTRREQGPAPSAISIPITVREHGLSMAETLVLTALDRLAPEPDDLVVDAYCGVGTFAILMAPLVGRAIGIEESPAAVKDATANAAGIENVRFIAGKTEDLLPKLEDRPNKALLDPARVGCDRSVLVALIQARLERIVYVSCEPATLARDLAILREGGYSLASVQPVDMFPQTAHIESVSLLIGSQR
jgi:23S rRNA (uracil1939-C5)-methyltransferase